MVESVGAGKVPASRVAFLQLGLAGPRGTITSTPRWAPVVFALAAAVKVDPAASSPVGDCSSCISHFSPVEVEATERS